MPIGKAEELAFSLPPLRWAWGGKLCWDLAGPMRTTAFVTVLWDLWAKAPLDFRTRCLQGLSSSGSFQSGGPGVPSKSCILQGEARSWGFLLSCVRLCPQWSLWHQGVPVFPSYVDVGICSFGYCVGVTHPVLGFPQEENTLLRVALCSVHPREKEKSGASYVTIMIRKPRNS